jgi:hypothetical protein
MAHSIEREPGIGPLKFLGRTVTSNKSKGAPNQNSIYVSAPGIKSFNFHTHPTGSGKVPDYYKDPTEFGKDEYVWLHYEESRFTDGLYHLVEVSEANLSMPDYETMADSDMPKRCPVCGREGSAVVNTNTTYADDADVCEVPDDRRRWFDIPEDYVYIH